MNEDLMRSFQSVSSISNNSLIKPIVNPNLASEFYIRLISMINEYNRGLDNENEVGARLVNFGESITFHIENIGYYNPSLIIFYGKLDNGASVQLIQHISQISILLVTMKRIDISTPKHPIGFGTWEEFEQNKIK